MARGISREIIQKIRVVISQTKWAESEIMKLISPYVKVDASTGKSEKADAALQRLPINKLFFPPFEAECVAEAKALEKVSNFHGIKYQPEHCCWSFTAAMKEGGGGGAGKVTICIYHELLMQLLLYNVLEPILAENPRPTLDVVAQRLKYKGLSADELKSQILPVPVFTTIPHLPFRIDKAQTEFVKGLSLSEDDQKKLIESGSTLTVEQLLGPDIIDKLLRESAVVVDRAMLKAAAEYKYPEIKSIWPAELISEMLIQGFMSFNPPSQTDFQTLERAGNFSAVETRAEMLPSAVLSYLLHIGHFAKTSSLIPVVFDIDGAPKLPTALNDEGKPIADECEGFLVRFVVGKDGLAANNKPDDKYITIVIGKRFFNLMLAVVDTTDVTNKHVALRGFLRCTIQRMVQFCEPVADKRASLKKLTHGSIVYREAHSVIPGVLVSTITDAVMRAVVIPPAPAAPQPSKPVPATKSVSVLASPVKAKAAAPKAAAAAAPPEAAPSPAPEKKHADNKHVEDKTPNPNPIPAPTANGNGVHHSTPSKTTKKHKPEDEVPKVDDVKEPPKKRLRRGDDAPSSAPASPAVAPTPTPAAAPAPAQVPPPPSAPAPVPAPAVVAAPVPVYASVAVPMTDDEDAKLDALFAMFEPKTLESVIAADFHKFNRRYTGLLHCFTAANAVQNKYVSSIVASKKK